MATNIRFPKVVHDELAELAREQRRSLNSAVVVAVERYIRQMKARQPREGHDGR